MTATTSLRERLEQSARDLAEHRQTHVVWRDWLLANPANADINPHAGSAEFHAGVILDYDRHLSNIREAIAALSTPPAGEWMPIASAPKDGQRILLANASGGRFIGRYEHGEGWLDDSSRFRDPTHWQPLPPPPEPATQEVG